MSSSRLRGPSSRKRSRRNCKLDPVPDDDDAESVSDNNDSDPRILQILPDSESPTFTIEQPSYMNDESSFCDVDFATLVNEKYYVDKTDVIPRILNLSGWAVAIFRHQYAMKTTHLKSIECYCDWKSIEGLDFEKLKVKTNDHFQKYCALFIPFDEITLTEAKDANDVVAALKMVIIDSVKQYLQEHLTDKPDEIEFTVEKLRRSDDIGLLRDICFEFHLKFSKKVIILFDNVDMPFLNYDIKYTELAYKTFFNGFTSHHSSFCFKLIMMGNIAPHCFFKLGSFGSKLFVDCGYRVNPIGLEYFMFNEKDVEKLCNEYNRPVPQTVIELKSRYGGYKVEGDNLLNSFSIVEFFNSNFVLDSPMTSILWCDSYSKDVLHVSSDIKISKAEQFIWTRLLESDGNININIHVIPNYDDFIHSLHIGFKFLLYGAYLTIVEEKYPNTTLKIPNEEVREIFRERRNKFMSCEGSSSNYEEPNKLFNDSSYESFCINLNEILIKCSSRTFNCELAYYVFLLVILACNSVFEFKDEPETGLGFSDIVLIPKTGNVRRPIVIEIAYLETKNEKTLERLFQNKLDQVNGRPYGRSLLAKCEKIDILIVIGCNRTLYYKSFPNVNVPS